MKDGGNNQNANSHVTDEKEGDDKGRDEKKRDENKGHSSMSESQMQCSIDREDSPPLSDKQDDIHTISPGDIVEY